MRRLALSALLLGFALPFLHTLEAHAQLVVAPPVTSKNVKKWKKSIGKALLRQLDKEKINRIKLPKKQGNALKVCKNKLSCLAEAGQKLGASHVLHTIVGRRGDKVKAQFTIVSTETGKPIAKVRTGSKASQAAVRGAIMGAVIEVVAELRKLPEFQPAKPPPAVAVAPALTPKVEPKPEPKPEPKKETKPVAETKPENVETRQSPGLVARTERDPGGTNWLAWGTMGGGGIVAVSGLIALGMANGDINQRNETPQIDPEGRQSLTDSAAAKQTVGVTLLLIGGAAIITGSVFHLMGIGAPEKRLAITPTANGFAFTF